MNQINHTSVLQETAPTRLDNQINLVFMDIDKIHNEAVDIIIIIN